jgi:hypothetical protein
MKNIELNTLEEITLWFEKTNPVPTNDCFHKSLSKHLEKTSQLLLSFRDVGRDFNTREQIGLSADVMSHIQRQVRAGRNGIELVVEDIDTDDLLHNLCGQVVTSIGIAHSLKLDIIRALLEICASYTTKYDEEGNPFFNDQSNPVNGPNYRSPDLTPYI